MKPPGTRNLPASVAALLRDRSRQTGHDYQLLLAAYLCERFPSSVAHVSEVDRRLEEAGLDVMPYTKWGRYRVRVTKADLAKHQNVVAELLKRL